MTSPLDRHHDRPGLVASFADRGEAEVAKAHLGANGIHAEIIDDVEGGAIRVDGEPGVRVMVPAEDLAAARALLESS